MIEPTTVLRTPFKSPLAGIGEFLAQLHDRLAQWRDNAKGRRQLAAMDCRMVKDLGLTRVDVWREANKPFWEP